MSKYYKYIVIGYLIVCIVLIGFSLVPRNPFKYSGKEVVLNDKALLIREDKEYEEFSNYELNFISDYNLVKGYQKGRNMNYYSHDENYEYFDAEYYMRVEMNDDVLIDTFYFNDSNIILCKVKMNYNDFLNYRNYLKIKFDYNIIDWNVSYKYKDCEYSITTIRNVVNNNIYLFENNYSVRTSLYKPVITASVFLSVDNVSSNQGFYVEILRKTNDQRRSLSIGLNTIKDDVKRTYIEYLGSYLEIK